MRSDHDAKVYLFCGYDGLVMMSRPLNMPWHGLTISDKNIQALPSVLRVFPDDYSRLKRIGYRLVRSVRNFKNKF